MFKIREHGCYSHTLNAGPYIAKNFILEVQYGGGEGGQISGRMPRAGVWKIFGIFFFEMVHFGAKVINAACIYIIVAWFSGDHSEKTDLTLINFYHNFGGAGS